MTGSLSSPPRPINIAASNTPIPAGVWLAKPSIVATMKTAVIREIPIFTPAGNSTYIASAAAPRSIIPIAICSNTMGPDGSLTGQRQSPMHLGLSQLQTMKVTTPSSSAIAINRLTGGGR